MLDRDRHKIQKLVMQKNCDVVLDIVPKSNRFYCQVQPMDLVGLFSSHCYDINHVQHHILRSKQRNTKLLLILSSKTLL